MIVQELEVTLEEFVGIRTIAAKAPADRAPVPVVPAFQAAHMIAAIEVGTGLWPEYVHNTRQSSL
jgi:hypothetical protein